MRNWKKTVCLLLSLALVGSLLSGCGPKAPAETGSKSDPVTYEGAADGRNGPLKVSVTVAEGKITEVKVTEHTETESIAGMAITGIPEKIVEKQSLAIDSVAGATITCDAILAAVKAALANSGLDLEKLSTPAQGSVTSGEAHVIDADVVVIGAGAAGFAAAVKVAEAGKSVVILEKMPVVGGNTIRAGGAMNAADPERQNTQTMKQSEVDAILALLALEPKNDDMARWQKSVKKDMDAYIANGDTYLYDSVDLHKLQTYVDGDYLGNTTQIEYLCDNSLESIHWLESNGVGFKSDIRAVVGAVWQRSHALEREDEMGVAIIEPLQAVAEKSGAKIYLNTKAEELIMTDGKVTGVRATQSENGDTYTFNAKDGVIIATGGFAASVEMREKYNTSGKWANIGADIPTSNHPGATGDGIVMAQAIGAGVVDMEQIQFIPLWLKGVASATKGYINNVIYVNQQGDRFVKEDGRRDELSMGALAQPGGYFYVINDHADALYNGYTDEALAQIVTMEGVFTGNTIEELAANMGADPAKLKASVDAFNASVDSGEDAFGRKVFDQKIEAGPFYASCFGPAVHHTMGGLTVNTSAQVLDTAGNAIPGLFAAGEVTGGLHGTNRLGGNAVPDAIVNGMNAGVQVLK